MGSKDNDKGVFVISIDYELLWGVWDVTTKDRYGRHIIGVKEAVPLLLDLFKKYDFKATFAIVGILFAQNKNELLSNSPDLTPPYKNDNYNIYKSEIDKTGFNETDDPYHFGFKLVEIIRQSQHELATHTFSHYYCLEEGQTCESFDADIKAAIKIALAQNVEFKSIVFPRNQVNPEYFDVLKDNGITVYRGNPKSWIYTPRKYAAEIPFIRICRLIDTYVPITSYNSHRINRNNGVPVNIPASRFLKPYNRNLAWFEKLKLKRIMSEMTHAAKNNELYHLWWHPHNFGVNIKENIANLTVLLNHYKYLNDKYGFTNLTMKEAAGY